MRKRKTASKKQTNIILVLAVFIIGVGCGIIIQSEEFLYVGNTEFDNKVVAQINLAAIDNNGDGVAVPIKVEIKEGTGKVLTNIEKLLFWVDTQQSIQTAKQIAENYTNTDMSKLDILYSIDTDRTGIIGGPSAGAALTQLWKIKV